MQNIFNIKTEEDFLQKSLESFRYQYENVEIYQKFCDFLKISIEDVQSIQEIPFLPIDLFKNHLILDKNSKVEHFFQSSGTTQLLNRSKHFITDFKLYEESILLSFKNFIGDPKDFIILGLLPNYSENQHSSLIYMVDFLMKESSKPENGYFLYNHNELFELLIQLKNRKVILFGVSFALLDFLDFLETNHHIFTSSHQLTIIETGGMKGRKEEITKNELLQIFQNGFKTKQIFSEYSMTELFSQAYSLGENLYKTPNWMKVLIRDTEDPFQYLSNGKTGAINIIDLANKHSCSFIATQDLGKISGHKFEVLGRIDHSDIRGCSLLVT